MIGWLWCSAVMNEVELVVGMVWVVQGVRFLSDICVRAGKLFDAIIDTRQYSCEMLPRLGLARQWMSHYGNQYAGFCHILAYRACFWSVSIVAWRYFF